jgi:predicted ATPase
MRQDLPVGTVTLVFTDIEGSTRLLEELGSERYGELLVEHHRVCRIAWLEHGGVEVDTAGDAFFVAFPTASGALAAAAEAQLALAELGLRVRMGVHTGEVAVAETGYVGFEVHRAARIAAAAHGGQLVVSETTAAAAAREGLIELGEHRFKDVDEPVAIYQLGGGTFPPLKTISNTNLPRPASSFVGREQELARVLAGFEHGARLVTLTGPGGSGKTRLAIEAATTLVPQFKAGVFWVGLASLRDPELVTETIAQTVGAKDGLAEHIGERELLLLLDNLEQVIEVAPDLSALVRACPNLRLLVTSREMLRIDGEVEYSVPPLAEPEAVALFCERAPTEPSDAIRELCARLDNLPLAVELAAARTKALSPAQILERLSQRLDLLRGGRDADPRQQTLRATIEWSHDLLSDEEQRLFRALSVFAGGCTLEAAEVVSDAELDTLQSLVEKSLVRFTNERYWMLETMREFAGERLAEHPDAGLPRRHALWFLTLAEAAWGVSGTAEHPDRLDALERDHANLRVAVDWAIAAGETAMAVRFGEALWEFWYVRGHLVEGDTALRTLVELDAIGAELHHAWVTFGSGTIARARGDPERASELHAEAFRKFDRLGVVAGMGSSLTDRAADLWALGDVRAARASIERAIAILREAGPDRQLGHALNNYSYLLSQDGRYEEAAAAATDALDVLRGVGDRWAVAVTIGSLAVAELGAGRLERARVLFSTQLTESAAVSSVLSSSEALEGLASIEARTGRPESAARLWGASQARLREINSVLESAHDSNADQAHVRAELGEARYEALLGEGAALTDDQALELARSID